MNSREWMQRAEEFRREGELARACAAGVRALVGAAGPAPDDRPGPTFRHLVATVPGTDWTLHGLLEEVLDHTRKERDPALLFWGGTLSLCLSRALQGKEIFDLLPANDRYGAMSEHVLDVMLGRGGSLQRLSRVLAEWAPGNGGSGRDGSGQPVEPPPTKPTLRGQAARPYPPPDRR